MPVVAGRAQVAAAAPWHQLRLIPPAQNMAAEFMPVVKADGLGAFQPSHAAHQVGVGRFQHQIVMIAQQTIRVNLPIGFLAGRGQRFQEILPVHVIQEYPHVGHPGSQGCSKVRPVEGRSCSAALKSEDRRPKPERRPKSEFREWPDSIGGCSAGVAINSDFGPRVWNGPARL